MPNHPYSGIYAAAITPLNPDGSIALDEIPEYLHWLSNRGCHGALILGTTGEGPSFSTKERLSICKASYRIKDVKPEFRLLVGTGTPSLDETLFLTRTAFEIGFEGAVVLPPYYYHQATEEGIFQWFQSIIDHGVPENRFLLGYHFPAQSGVPIPINVISKLKEKYPGKFAGFKDSTSKAELTALLGTDLDQNVLALVGNEIFLSQTLSDGGSGCITAMANLFSPNLRNIWDNFQSGDDTNLDQDIINKNRNILDGYRPFPPTIKFLLSEIYGFPEWAVKSPLIPLDKEKRDKLLDILSQ